MHLAHQRALNKVINSQSKKQKSSLMFLLTCTHLFLDRKKGIFIEFLSKVSYGWKNSQPLYHLDPNQRCMILTFSVNWYTVYLVLFRMSQNLRRGNICNIFILRSSFCDNHCKSFLNKMIWDIISVYSIICNLKEDTNLAKTGSLQKLPDIWFYTRCKIHKQLHITGNYLEQLRVNNNVT